MFELIDNVPSNAVIKVIGVAGGGVGDFVAGLESLDLLAHRQDSTGTAVADLSRLDQLLPDPALKGGRLDVESTPGQGTAFTITLPIGREH